VHNFNNYSQALFDANQTDNAVSLGLKSTQFLKNDLLLYKSSKKTTLFCKLLDYKKTTNSLNTYTTLNRTECANSLLDNSKNFLFNSKKVQLVASDIYFNKKKTNFSNYVKNKVNILSPLIIVNYIANFLNKNIKNKLNLPNQNIQIIITRFLDLILNFNKQGIVGIKVICSGK